METCNEFKIFLVDDDQFNLLFNGNQLAQLGYSDVSKFENGTDCLNHLTAKPDVVFLDHHMDDMSGFEVLKKIKRFDPNIYVVMLSGQENMKTAIDALKYGAFDYIIKGEEVPKRIKDVMLRITEVQAMLEKSKPSIWKKIGSII